MRTVILKSRIGKYLSAKSSVFWRGCLTEEMSTDQTCGATDVKKRGDHCSRNSEIGSWFVNLDPSGINQKRPHCHPAGPPAMPPLLHPATYPTMFTNTSLAVIPNCILESSAFRIEFENKYDGFKYCMELRRTERRRLVFLQFISPKSILTPFIFWEARGF